MKRLNGGEAFASRAVFDKKFLRPKIFTRANTLIAGLMGVSLSIGIYVNSCCRYDETAAFIRKLDSELNALRTVSLPNSAGVVSVDTLASSLSGFNSLPCNNAEDVEGKLALVISNVNSMRYRLGNLGIVHAVYTDARYNSYYSNQNPLPLDYESLRRLFQTLDVIDRSASPVGKMNPHLISETCKASVVDPRKYPGRPKEFQRAVDDAESKKAEALKTWNRDVSAFMGAIGSANNCIHLDVGCWNGYYSNAQAWKAATKEQETQQTLSYICMAISAAAILASMLWCRKVEIDSSAKQ